MKGRMIVTDRAHTRAERQIFPAPAVPAAEKLKAEGEGFQGFLGFGVAITPSSCYELSLMEPKEREALLKQIYGKEGLGLSVARLCMGSSDYSPEIYSYDDTEGDTALSHFSVERDEAYVIPMIREILKVNPALYLFASPWSPPGWMKTGGKMCGGYMREEFVELYADYFIRFLQEYEKRGIHISAVTPQNECNTQQSGRMPACIWHPETEAKFVRILREKCKAAGLKLNVWIYDHSFLDTERVLWQLKHCKGLKESCEGVAFHYYNGYMEDTKEITRLFPQLELHFTEGGPRLTDRYDTDWCKWGTVIIQALKAGYRSFTGWNLMLDECGGPNVGPFLGICAGLVTRDSRDGSLSFSGQYKAFSHIAPYLTPETKIYPLSGSGKSGWMIGNFPKFTHGAEGILLDSQKGKKIALLVNPNESGMQAQLEIDGVLWYLELTPESINTVVIE